MRKYTCILIAILIASAAAQAQPHYFALQNRKNALERELQYIRDHPGAFYLVVDLSVREVHLKADANLLRTCPIQSISGGIPSETGYAQFLKRIDPVAIEPGNDHLRLRGRLFPLDFVERLTEGSRRRSMLYFAPDLLLTPPDAFPHIANTACAIALDAGDIKALGAALQAGQAAIVIPPGKIP